MATRILLRRGFTADWNAANPVLLYGEVGIELNNDQAKDIVGFRIGDGEKNWNSLAYFQDANSLVGGVIGDDISVNFNTLKKIADYVDGKILPAGGASGRALVKSGANDYDVQWAQLRFSTLEDVNMAGIQNRDSLVYDGPSNKWIRTPSPRIYVQSTAPTNALEGDLWIF